MRARGASNLAGSVLALACLLTAAGWWFAALNAGTPIPPELADVTPGSDALLLLAILPFSVVGAQIVARRPGNRIGAVFLATGLGGALGIAATQYAIHAFLTDPGSLPAGALGGLAPGCGDRPRGPDLRLLAAVVP